MSQGFDYQRFSQAHGRLTTEYRKRQASHALLLCGSSGMMKASFAVYLAQILLCQAESDVKPCGRCRSCLRCQAGSHGNLITLGLAGDAKSIRIEQLRALFSVLSLHPAEPGPRVIVIKDMHTMTPQAQNALLKSLEEPQNNDYFLLTSDNERAVLPTIISRCNLVRLPALEDEKLEELLLQHGCNSKQAKELSLLSSGRIGFALSVLNDSTYWTAKALAEKTFFSLKTLTDIPAASMALKDARDPADLLFDLIEQEARHCLEAKFLPLKRHLTSPWSNADTKQLKRLLEALFEARKYKASNVSWQSITDRLLFSIAKEIYQCQW